MLTGKQKRFLRSLAVNERPLLHIGKEGLSKSVFDALDQLLESKELVKVAILKNCEVDIDTVSSELCKSSSCFLIQKIGKNLVLYRQSKERKIILP